MTGLAWALLAVAAVAALANWWAVEVGDRRVEWVAKPATLALLVGVALALDPVDGAVRAWFVAALVLSLAGDVFLMLPNERFVAGLASFLLAHVAYIVGFVVGGGELAWALVGLVVVVAMVATVGRRIVGAVKASDEPALAGPVQAYLVAISAMVVVAFASTNPVAVVGALLFYASDACIAWGRFVADLPHQRLAVMTTYHLGQAGLVLSLVVAT